MTERSPDNDVWLERLIDRTPLLPDRALRRHWRRVIPWLPTASRYELAAILVEVEHAFPCE